MKLSIRKHLASLSTKAPATYNLPMGYLRAFCRWCIMEGYLIDDPTQGITKRKDEGKARAIELDVIKLLQICDQETFAGLRDYSLILLQLDWFKAVESPTHS